MPSKVKEFTMMVEEFLRYARVECWKCREPISIGDDVVLRRSSKPRLYHKRCYDSMWHNL